MALYRKKPLVVHAIRWLGFGDKPDGANMGMLDDDNVWVCKRCGENSYMHGTIQTLEGFLNVCPGDWIIKGIAGEFYPCKHEIFEATYEALDAQT